MKFGTLIEALDDSVSFEFRGDRNQSFEGTELRLRNIDLANRLLVLVDDNWGPGTIQRYRESRHGTNLERVTRVLNKGVSGVVVPRRSFDEEMSELLKDTSVFVVEDTHDFAWAIVRAMQSVCEPTFITAITGSAGKSTTQAMIAHALRGANVGAVYAPDKNQNLAESPVWQLTRIENISHLVLEVSGTAARRVHRSNRAIGSDVAIVTAISEAHLAEGQGLRDIAIRKATIFASPAVGGTAVINLDAPHSDLLVRRAYRAGRQVITYGESSQAGIQILEYDPNSRKATVRVGAEEYSYVIGAPGRHLALNSLAVIATLRSYRIPNWFEGIESLASFKAIGGRGEIFTLNLSPELEIKVIDESYNANPASMRAALELLSSYQVDGTGRRVAVLGDMLELGPQSEKAHAALKDDIRKYKPDLLLLFGAEMKTLHEQLASGESQHWGSLTELLDDLPALLQSGDLVLAKASHGMGLNAWVSQQRSSQS